MRDIVRRRHGGIAAWCSRADAYLARSRSGARTESTSPALVPATFVVSPGPSAARVATSVVGISASIRPPGRRGNEASWSMLGQIEQVVAFPAPKALATAWMKKAKTVVDGVSAVRLVKANPRKVNISPMNACARQKAPINVPGRAEKLLMKKADTPVRVRPVR